MYIRDRYIKSPVISSQIKFLFVCDSDSVVLLQLSDCNCFSSRTLSLTFVTIVYTYTRITRVRRPIKIGHIILRLTTKTIVEYYSALEIFRLRTNH